MCVASYLLDLNQSDAREYVATALDGSNPVALHYAATALLHHLYRLHCSDSAEDSWAMGQMIRVLKDDRLLMVDGKLPKGSYTIKNKEAVSDSFDGFCRELGELKWRPAVGPLIDVLSRHPDERGAAYSLGRIGDVKAIPMLHKTAVDSEGRLRLPQAQALVDLGDKECVALLAEHLEKSTKAGSTEDTYDSYTMINLLQQTRDKRAVQPLREYVAKPRTQCKGEAKLAMAVLEASDKEDLARRLVRLLEDESDLSAQYDIIEQLGDCRWRQAVGVLLKYAKPREEGLVCDASIKALGKTGGPEAIRGVWFAFWGGLFAHQCVEG